MRGPRERWLERGSREGKRKREGDGWAPPGAPGWRDTLALSPWRRYALLEASGRQAVLADCVRRQPWEALGDQQQLLEPEAQLVIPSPEAGRPS